jgi:hypothetical protein
MANPEKSHKHPIAIGVGMLIPVGGSAEIPILQRGAIARVELVEVDCGAWTELPVDVVVWVDVTGKMRYAL